MNKLLFGCLLIFLMLNAINVIGQTFSDPKGDLQDKNGNPATGDPFSDIIETNLVMDGSSYVGMIGLDGEVPSKTSDSALAFEWDFMIDADKNPSTNPWGGTALLRNDIGVDYMVRLVLLDSNRHGEVWDGSSKSSRRIDSQISGNEIKLKFSASDLGGSTSFSFIVLTRKYGDRGSPNSLILFDKAPNEGHYTFQASSARETPQTTQSTPIVTPTPTQTPAPTFSLSPTTTPTIIQTPAPVTTAQQAGPDTNTILMAVVAIVIIVAAGVFVTKRKKSSSEGSP